MTIEVVFNSNFFVSSVIEYEREVSLKHGTDTDAWSSNLFSVSSKMFHVFVPIPVFLRFP